MKTIYYFIEGEEIAVVTADETVSLPTDIDFENTLNSQLADELVFFDVFDDSYIQDNNTKHAVINYKNLTDELKHELGLNLVMIRSLISSHSKAAVYAMFKAMQVLRWKLDHTFCSRCGSRTSSHRNELAMVCNTCQYRQYPRLQPCIIVAITREVNDDEGNKKTQILLAKDRRFKRDMHSVLAGFVEVGETLEQAVQREVLEESNLQVKNISYLGSQPWPFPSNIMIAFHAEYAGGELKIDTDELLHAAFYDLDKLPTIPPEGSISNEMIRHVCDGKVISL